MEGLMGQLIQMLGGAGGNAGAVSQGVQKAQASQALGQEMGKSTFSDFFSNPAAMAQVFGSIGSAISARDPNSWQHQLGNTATKMGKGQSFKDMMNSLAIRQLAGQKDPASANPLTKPAAPTALDDNGAGFALPTLDAVKALSGGK